MGENEYKISLGVDIDVDDLQTQINIAGNKVKPIPIKVEIENLNEIKKQLQNLGGTKGKAEIDVPIDTKSIKGSLEEVSSYIKEIKDAIGTLDSKSGMKSLLSSINQISTALDKASDKFAELNNNLSALSGKDLSLNLGINLGGSNSVARQGVYGSKVRNETLPQLKQQVGELVKYYNSTYKEALNEFEALQRMVSGTKLNNGDFFEGFLYGKDSVASRMGNGSLSSQMQAYKAYIDMFKQAANLKGLDLSSVTSGFSKSADELIKDAQDVQTGAKEMENSFEKLKQILGGSGIDAEGLGQVLEPIITDLREIKEALQGLSSGVSLKGLTQSFDKLSDTIEKIITNAGTFQNTISGAASHTTGVSNVVQDFKAMDVAMDKVEGEARNLEGALKQMGVADTNIATITQQVDELGVTAQKVSGSFNKDGSFSIKVTGIKELNDDLEQTVTLMQRFGKDGSVGNLTTTLTEDLRKASAAFEELKIKADGLSTTASISNVGKQYASTELALKSLSQTIPSVQTSFEGLGGTYRELTSAQQHYKEVMAASDATDEQKIDAMHRLINANERYQNSLATTNNLITEQKKTENIDSYSDKLTTAREGALLRLKSLFNENSEAAKHFAADVDRIQKEINECNNISGFSNINKEITNLGREIKQSGYQVETFGQKLKKQWEQYRAYLSVASLISYGTQALRNMFEQVKLIDSAMTELKKVTNETDEAYNKFLSNAADRAREIGTTIDGLVSSTADFARLGYGFEDAQGLAEVANIYAVVGDEIEGVEGATESLISTMAAFKGEMNGMSNSDFAMSIIDSFNELGNNFAISSGGLGEALERSASSLAAANNTLHESAAMITAANEVTQNPEKVGNALKTISMRIRSAKTEMEEMGEDTTGMVESTAKLRSEIMALSGVDIMLDANNFKSTYQIMDELSKKWKDLSDISQATIIELMAGKHQGNVFASLMTNFQTARDALDTSLNSSGSAMKEHEKWQQSLEAQINNLKASWQGLSQAFLKSDFLKTGIKLIIKFVDAISTLVDAIGVIPTLATGFGIFQSFKGNGFFKPIIDEATGAAKGITSIFGKAANNIKTSLSNINTNNGFSASLNQNDIQALIAYNGQLQANVDKTTAWNDCMAQASQAAQEAARSNAFLSNGLNGYIKSQQAANVSTLASNKSLGNAKVLLNEYYSGCQATGMGVDDFRDAVAKTNPQLAAQMTATGSASAGLKAYRTATIAARAGALALKVGVMALNAALTMGVSWAISKVIQLFDEWHVSSKELAEQVEEVTSKFKEQHKSLQKMKGDFNTDNESSMISRYAKLSKGVDHLNRNVSLTSDEYSEYLSIVDKVADTFPSLVQGYDGQGKAILSCKDDVAALTAEYERLIETNADTVLVENLDKIADDFANKIDSKKKQSLKENIGSFLGADELFGMGIELTDSSLSHIKRLLDSKNKGDAAINQAIEDSLTYNDAFHDYKSQIITALQEQDVDINTWNYKKKLKEVILSNPAKLQAIIDKYEVDMESFASSMKEISTATLTKAFDISSSDYYDMDDAFKNVAYNIVNGFDAKFYEKYQTNPEGIINHIHGILDQLKTIEKEGNINIKAAFDLQTQFNGGEISYGDYVDGLENTGKTIDQLVSSGKLDKEIGTQLKLSIGLDGEGVVKEYDILLKKLSEKSDAYDFDITEGQAKELLDGLSSEELAIAVDVITEMQENGVEETIEEVRNAIDRQLAINGLTLQLDIEVEKTKLEALTTALTESFSGSGLSSESITAVEDMFSGLSSYDPSKLFERTANGIKLNNVELRKLNNESKKTNIAKINKEMDSLGDIYNKTREELYNLTYGTDEYNKKSAELKSIEDRIKATEKLAAGYQGLASAYQEWQMAESSGSERGMYEGLLEGWENVGDELSRGWVDDGTREFIELLKGETTTIVDGNGVKKEINIATASAKELKQVWKDLDKNIQHTTYSVHDFFTVDDEGNSTSKGIYNFLDAIGQMEEEKFNGKDVVKRDKNGNIIGFDFEIVGGDKVIAEALGISEELVQIMKRASADAGFVVSFDGTYQQLDILREKAQTASETLNKVLKEKGHSDRVYSYNFNSTDVEDIKTQLDKANIALGTFQKGGKIDLSMEGAQEALTVASTLQSMLDKLQRPAYMQIEVSEVEKNLQEPLRNLQELRTLTETEHQLKLTGADTSELQESKQEIYDYFENLAPEVKAELGLVDDNGIPLTGQALQDKLNSGEIAIEATVDIQMSMDDKLGILVDKALYDAGIIDKKEFTKRVNVYLEADEVDDSDVDDKVEETFEEGNGEKPVVQKEVEIEIVEDTNDKIELNNLINNVNPDPIKKKVIVEYFTEHSDVDNYTPNQKKALVEFIANTDNLDEYTPEEKQAIVEYLTDSSDPDSWTPEQKEAVAKFIRESSEVDSYTPDQKEAIAKFIKDSIEPDSYTPPSLTSTVTFNKDTTDVDGYDPPNFTRYVTYYAKKAFTTGAKAGEKALENRFGIVNGTANSDGASFANGTAFKQGNWRTKKTERALVGELGQELVVTGNRWYTVGDMGAEFTTIPKGSIVFNHKQTEELFKNGKVTSNGGRGRFLANGTAFAQGTAYNGYDGKDSYNVDENKKETYDWIEVLLTRLERAVNNFTDAADDTYTSWTKREKALYEKKPDGTKTGALVKNQELIDELSKAITAYENAADRVDLSESIKEKVREGALDPNDSSITEEQSKKIQEYKTLWENYLEAQDKHTEALRTQVELQAKYFDNILSKYDDILQGFAHTEFMLNEYISQAEAKGHIVSKDYYQALRDNKNDELAQLRAEQSALVAERNRLESNGVEVGSEKWYELCKEIDNVTQAIEQGNTALIEYNNSMRDIDWEVFDLIQERISNINSEAEFFIELMSNKNLFDDDGKMTNEGLATMGMYAQKYNTHMYLANDYKTEIQEIDRQIEALDELGDYDENLNKRRQELLELQRESILAAEQEKQAIKDLISEGIDKELDALQERIDLRNEELNSMKNIYDYQKQVSEQSAEIATLEKQRAAYLSDTSDEGQAKLQEITVSLKEAKESLAETEFDRYISQQEELLSTLYEEYELILNERLDNLDGLITESFAAVNEKADIINATIGNVADGVGIEMSEELANIWSGENGIEGVVREYGDSFSTSLTSVITTLGTIKDSVNTLVGISNTKADTKVASNKTSTSAKKDPTSGSSGSSNKTSSSSSSNKSTNGDGSAKIGDKVKFLSGKYYYDSQGVNPAGSKYHNKQVYITNINKKSWATHPYHISTGKKLGQGDLGWLKLNQLSGYATGKKNFLNDEIAWTQEKGQEFIVRPSDGAILTPIAKGDSVLTSAASNNIWDMANSPTEFIKDNLNLGIANVPNSSNVNNSYSQHIDNVVFRMDNVKNYEEMLYALKDDRRFEKLVTAMTIDRVAGKSSLAKNKSIR